jgi:hypothetical protein
MLNERIGRRGFVYGIAALGVGASGCVGDSNGDQEAGTRGDEESGEDGGSEEDGESGEDETGAEEGDESGVEETTDEDYEDADFALYFTAEDDRLVATEEGVKPGSVSKDVARDGSHRVSFALTEDAVHGLEDAVEGVDKRKEAEVRIEYDGEIVFDGPVNPSLWQHLRNGDFADADGQMSVTGLEEEEADELARLLSQR